MKSVDFKIKDSVMLIHTYVYLKETFHTHTHTNHLELHGPKNNNRKPVGSIIKSLLTQLHCGVCTCESMDLCVHHNPLHGHGPLQFVLVVPAVCRGVQLLLHTC